jgi:hypothetical protein
MSNFDDLKLAVEALTGGKNTVLLDDVGLPSIMVVWPKQKNNALFTGGLDVVHPGSIVNMVEKDFYVSKYQNVVYNNRAYSLPMRDPRANINFDTALANCRNKGRGWGLTPYSLWAQIALWCRKNGTMPRGNNNYGSDHAYAHEKGVPSMELDSNNRVQRCATGSGPATWNHNWLPDGIADLNGNVSEWCAGMRIVDGEIQVIPYANCMDPEVSLGASSTAWKAISAEGDLVEPGTSGTLKYDWLSGKITLTTDAVTDDGSTYRSTGYTALGLKSGLTVPELAKALILYPDEPGGDYGGDYRYVTLAGERVPLCGGAWYHTGDAGVFYGYLAYDRGTSYGNFGFRSAYCDL